MGEPYGFLIDADTIQPVDFHFSLDDNDIINTTVLLIINNIAYHNVTVTGLNCIQVIYDS